MSVFSVRVFRMRFLIGLCIACISAAVLLVTFWLAAGVALTSARAIEPAADDRAIAHVLNRIAYGPRPGDVERVREMGLPAYIEQQLHPERISDTNLASILKARDARVAQTETDGGAVNTVGTAMSDPAAGQIGYETIRSQVLMTELSEKKILRAVYSERQLQEVLTDFWFNHFNVFVGLSAITSEWTMLREYERDAIVPHVLGRFRDLLGATAHSAAMLYYLDNWVSVDPTGPHADPTEQRVSNHLLWIAPMRRPDYALAGNLPPAQERRRIGLNENYARELMELHTLGVDGGYTQKDVVAVARAFTGWAVKNPARGGVAYFDARMHDRGAKRVLGHTIPGGGGEEDGEQVLDILARHPSTAMFISRKLARRFVSDDPPAALVERTAATFRASDGDLRLVLRTILTSPEFLSADAYRAKLKTPFELVISAVRTSGAVVTHCRGLIRALQQLAMPPYFARPPTGYLDTADAWMSAGALANRINFAVALANNRVWGVRVNLEPLSGDTTNDRRMDAGARRLAHAFLQGDVSDRTLALLAKADGANSAAALVLGTAEFQKR